MPPALIGQMALEDRLLPGKEPVRFFEMNLQRIGATDWPAAGMIGPK